jgi:hypothetical protein
MPKRCLKDKELIARLSSGSWSGGELVTRSGCGARTSDVFSAARARVLLFIAFITMLPMAVQGCSAQVIFTLCSDLKVSQWFVTQ